MTYRENSIILRAMGWYYDHFMWPICYFILKVYCYTTGILSMIFFTVCVVAFVGGFGWLAYFLIKRWFF
jgi:hypothetical protein